MFVWAKLPAAFEQLGSLEFARTLATDAHVAVSPGVGFGEGGEGHVRFALVENEERIGRPFGASAACFRRADPSPTLGPARPRLPAHEERPEPLEVE